MGGTYEERKTYNKTLQALQNRNSFRRKGVSAFSRADLVNRLLYEGFTAEQVEYGVTAVSY